MKKEKQSYLAKTIKWLSEGKGLGNDLFMNRLILRAFCSLSEKVGRKAGSMFVRDKRSSQNGLNEVNGFSIFGTSGPKRVGDIKRPMVYGLQLITLFCVLFSFASVVEAQAQEPRQGGATGQTAIKPLEIGDTIPEELWHLPLQVVNHPEGKETITLNDYRGKGLIMLDFMSTGCSGCVKALPAMEEVAGGFDGEVMVLPVTHEQADRMRSFRKHNHLLKDSELTYVVEDSMLKKYFPHQYISHLVWIDKDGVIKAFTNTSQVRDFTVTDFLNGRAGDWVVKTETTDFFNRPLIYVNSPTIRLRNNRQRPYRYVLMTGFTEGVSAYTEATVDSPQKGKIVSYRNRSILDLYLIATNLSYKLKANQVIFEVESIDNYDVRGVDFSNITRDDWFQKNAVCYEQYVSDDMSDAEYRNQMLQNLNNLLGLQSVVENRNDKPFLIISKKQTVK